MYLGTTPEERRLARTQTVRPNLRDTVEQRRFEREADRIERQAAQDLRRAQRMIPSLPQSDPTIQTTAPGSPVVVPPSDAGPSQGDAPVGGGTSSANVTVSPGGDGGLPGWLIPVLIAGGSFLLFGM